MLSGVTDEIDLEVDVSCTILVRVGDLAQSREERDAKCSLMDFEEDYTGRGCDHCYEVTSKIQAANEAAR